MQQLSTDSIKKLDSLIQQAVTTGIKKLIIADGKIRGIDEKQRVVIITDNNGIDFGGKQIAINRVELLAARLNLVKTQGDLVISATEATSNPTDISLLDISSGKTKAQFRCASVDAVKVPKNVADKMVWEIKLSAKALAVLTQGISAMGTEVVTLASRDGVSVSLECTDTNKDVFTTEIEEPAKWISTDTQGTSFVQRYPAKTLVTLLKEAFKGTDAVTISIGAQGVMSVKISGLDYLLLPEA